MEKRKVIWESPGGCYGVVDIVCPYCGFNFGENSYFQHEGGKINNGGGFEVICDEDGCGKAFWVEPDYSIDYTSYPYEDEKGTDV